MRCYVKYGKRKQLIYSLPVPEKDIVIYALCEPDSNIIRYVGMTTVGFNRIKGHYDVARSRNSHCSNWIYSLKDKNQIFEVIYLEYFDVDGSEVDEAEKKWIKYYTDLGANLTNYEPGGRTKGFAARNMSDYRERMSKINGSEAKKKLFSEQSSARWADPEFREMMKTIPRKEITPEGRKKINDGAVKAFGVKLQDDLGNIFNSLREASDFHKIHKMSIQRASLQGTVIHGRTFNRLGGGRKDPSEVITDTYIKTGRKPVINEVIDHNGIIYQNIKLACEALGIDNKKAHRLLNNEIKNPCGITLKRVVK